MSAASLVGKNKLCQHTYKSL